MLSTLSFEEFSKLSDQSRPVFVHRQILANTCTPISAYQSLGNGREGTSFIETHLPDGTLQFSFLGVDPFLVMSVKDRLLNVSLRGSSHVVEGDPFKALKTLFEQHKPLCQVDLPFFGSYLGFFSYDAVRLFENILDTHAPNGDLPDILFQLFQTMVLFDHAKGVVTVLELAEPTVDSYQKALCRIETHIEKLASAYSPLVQEQHPSTASVSDLDDKSFIQSVQRAKEYLRQGDIFQVVLSRSFTKECLADPLAIYLALCQMNPSPYMFLLNVCGCSIVGASPEKLVSVHNGRIETVPIAGTCPRHQTLDDVKHEQNLLDDPKENAEHMMLVDLARNDLGIVSVPGSVKVARLKFLQRLSHVTHLVSEVQGMLKPGLSSLDVLKAAFPAGTLSGAPKIRAMEIIDELEKNRRGLYGGAICTFDFKGNMDSFLAIRMAIIKDGKAVIRAGAGIVLDSDPQKEADETRHKANGMLEAIRLAEIGRESRACND